MLALNFFRSGMELSRAWGPGTAGWELGPICQAPIGPSGEGPASLEQNIERDAFRPTSPLLWWGILMNSKMLPQLNNTNLRLEGLIIYNTYHNGHHAGHSQTGLRYYCVVVVI